MVCFSFASSFFMFFVLDEIKEEDAELPIAGHIAEEIYRHWENYYKVATLFIVSISTLESNCSLENIK